MECNPIPGFGSDNPKFLVLGLNPGLRQGIWCQYKSLEKLQEKYLQECLDSKYPYGKFLWHLEEFVPGFQITRTVYLTDLVKCPVVENSNPSKQMLNKCYLAYWQDLVETLDPDYIIALGINPTKLIGGFYRSGNKIQSTKILVGNKQYYKR